MEKEPSEPEYRKSRRRSQTWRFSNKPETTIPKDIQTGEPVPPGSEPLSPGSRKPDTIEKSSARTPSRFRRQAARKRALNRNNNETLPLNHNDRSKNPEDNTVK
jgi:hypothetical protein